MNESVLRVLKGFANLTPAEKLSFIEELNKYQSSDYYSKERFVKNINERASVGPKSSICTCCGR